MSLCYFERLEDGIVSFYDLTEEVGCVCVLGIEGWFCAWDGGVFGDSVGYFLSCVVSAESSQI